MPDGSIPLLISLIALILGSAFFSATETAFSCANKIKLKSFAANGNKRAAKVLFLSENNFDRLISTILIGNNIVNLTASTISALFFAKLLIDTNLNDSVISTAFITVVVLIFGEVTPKYIAKSCPEKFSMTVYPIIILLVFVFYPLNLLFSGWKCLISKIFRFKEEDVITEEEIITMVEEAEEDGILKEEEKNLIRSVIEFDDLDVSDIIIPRVNVVAVEKNDSIAEVKKQFEQSGFSRLPVYEGDIDSIIGTIHEKDFYRIINGNESSIKKIIKKPFFVTSHSKISKILKQMQKEKTHIAIVLDEYGGTAGLVTMEDILEELVGEIYDEHDDTVEYIKEVGDNSFEVHGETPLNKFFKYFELGESDEYDSNTVSGWVIELIGDFPLVNQKISYENFDIEVLEIDERIIQNIRIIKNKNSSPENENSEE